MTQKTKSFRLLTVLLAAVMMVAFSISVILLKVVNGTILVKCCIC